VRAQVSTDSLAYLIPSAQMHLLSSIMLAKSSCGALGKLFKLGGSVIVAAEVARESCLRVWPDESILVDAVVATDLVLVSFEHFLEVEHSISVFQKANLTLVILRCVGSHRWRSINLNQPRSQSIIQKHIEPVKLKAVLVINDRLLNRLQRTNDAVLDQGERLSDLFRPVLGHEEEFQTAEIPLASKPIIVVVSRLLNGDVGQMHVVVLNLVDLVRVALMRETAEARSVQVDSKWLVRGNEHVNTHIELFATNQQRVHHIPLHDVWLSLRTFWLPSEVVLPLSDLG
jgi:hypothetical protein